MTQQAPPGAPAQRAPREAFSSRTVFILAAIGSAVGLGNIWRFPYIAYENGGGAFLIPYLVALLTAGLPLLMLEYGIGHRFRASAPLAFRRLHPKTEWIGWWQMGISFVIAVYYAVILGYAMLYTTFSFSKAWGDDPGTFFLSDVLKTSEEVTVGLEFVPSVLLATSIAWLALLVVLLLGVQNGIGKVNLVLIPLLVLMFLVIVVIALTLPGATDGLNAFFTPNWTALTDSSVWVAAYGQIFFSLSVGFGIMITYSSYLKPKTDLASSGLVVGFGNSSFEILAGIGVFAALGFMAGVAGVGVDEVATSGIGLAFIAFPTIISEAPFGTLIGVLFFATLTFAGFTSLVSIVEVVVAAAQDKLGLRRRTAVLGVVVPMALISLALFTTTTGLNLLDVTDNFVNQFGIVAAALVSVMLLTAGFSALPTLRDHLNSVSSFTLGRTWMVMVGGVTPIVLGYILINTLTTTLAEGYGGMPTWFVNTFGWGTAIGLVIIALLLSRLPWPASSAASDLSPSPAILDAHVDRHRMRGDQPLARWSDTALRTPALGQDFSYRTVEEGADASPGRHAAEPAAPDTPGAPAPGTTAGTGATAPWTSGAAGTTDPARTEEDPR
ncbi:sodium-dependent transporter [Kocuria dechangensis]|uniref:Transporter n=1 Tax=Kocuria dechangensis TaxID=1176249 RepID=A0A917LSF7_9MICC|nr:sodium-dependent transporter [Kocuria dechangensis]GGG55018.1 sodium-dependent transporter [Kocuria dechangensis]